MSTYFELKRKFPVFLRAMLLNTPEWPFLIIGGVAGILAGTIHPLYSLIYAEALGVSLIDVFTGLLRCSFIIKMVCSTFMSCADVCQIRRGTKGGIV